MSRGLWDRDTIAWIMVAAIVPVAVAAGREFGMEFLWRLGFCLVVILLWQVIFLLVRAQPLSPIAGVSALAIAVLAPGTNDPLQLALAVSFGTVIGEQIFGGWGRNFIHPAVAALAFLYIGFPETVHEGAGELVAVSVVPGAIMLIVLGILSWQVLLAAILGLVAVTLAFGAAPGELLGQGSLAFALVFLIGDPVSSAATRPGRWIYGLFAGVLAALFGWADSSIGAPQSIVFAALLASVFAPLIDATIIALVSRTWRRRHG